MNRRIGLKVLFILGVLLVPTASFACDAAGPMTHVGKMMSVNTKNNTFTIKDMQSQTAITFKADDELLKGLQSNKGTVSVNYEEDGDELTAVGVSF